MELQLLVSVVQNAFFYGLLGLAFLLVLEGTGFFNFAIGPVGVVSGMVCSRLVFESELPLLVAVAAGVLAAVVLSVLTEVAIVRPISIRTDGDELACIIAVVALLFVLEQITRAVFGSYPLPGRDWVEGLPYEVGDVVIERQVVVIVVVVAAIYLAIGLWMRYSAHGRMLRAVGDNEGAARVVGLPVMRIRLLAFVVAGVLVGIGGPLYTGIAGVDFMTGLDWTLSGFLALIIGGAGRVWGPLVGGLVVSFVEVGGVYWFGPSVLTYSLLALAVVVFTFRPQGLFSRKVRA